MMVGGYYTSAACVAVLATKTKNMALLFVERKLNLPVCCSDDEMHDKSSHGRLRKRKATQNFVIKE